MNIKSFVIIIVIILINVACSKKDEKTSVITEKNLNAKFNLSY